MFGTSALSLFGTSQFLFDGASNTPLWTFFLFELTFCGAVAEQMRLSGYMLTSMVISAAIYPIIGHWIW